MSMKVKVLKPGLLTTIQDQGRRGYRDTGVPVSGAMDMFASSIANLLVGNHTSAPVLELTNGDAHMKCETGILISCCGDGSRLIVDGRELSYWKTLYLPAATEFRFKPSKTGCRTYVAIAGGWQADLVMGSVATYLPVRLGGISGRALHAGDEISGSEDLSVISMTMLSRLESRSVNYYNWGVHPGSFIDYQPGTVRVIPKQEFEWFDEFSKEVFYKDSFRLSLLSNRMGYQLDGEPLERIKDYQQRQLLSTSVTMGTIQVTASGRMIILMADCQTTGGYPRLAQVAAIDLPVCAQLKPGDTIQFREISMALAETALLQLQNDITILEKTITQRVLLVNNGNQNLKLSTSA